MGTLLLSLLIFVVSVVSGMLGIGAAFAAIPILGIHSQDLVHEVQPIALFLNGITAFFAAFAAPIVLIASLGALVGGSLASRHVPEKALRLLFIAIILLLAAYKVGALYMQH